MPHTDRKVAIVTGSATGVGAAAAIMLAEKNCNVVINYTRSKKEAEKTAEACRACGTEALVQQADVADDSACRLMAQVAIEAWGRIDYLINNAAQTKFNPFHHLEARCGPPGCESNCTRMADEMKPRRGWWYGE